MPGPEESQDGVVERFMSGLLIDPTASLQNCRKAVPVNFRGGFVPQVVFFGQPCTVSMGVFFVEGFRIFR